MSPPFFDSVARHLLSRHMPPDLRGAIVLLPNYHAAQPLAHALSTAANRPALLLPRMVTLDDWAQTIPLDAPVIPDSRRGALLYRQLRQRKWFDNADLWSMTQELLGLFDELTHALNDLPHDAEAFAAAVQRAWQARRNDALQLEARLVFELWRAMQGGAEFDAARACQQRLARLAQQADRPLYVLRTSDWDALEHRFLDEYAKRAAVEVFDLREMRAQSRPPLFFAATSLEEEARAAAMQVRRWLAEGRRDIAIVAQDRVVARRMRALLERVQVLVADETGWTFATLSVSTVLDRWLTALQSDFYHHDLLDLLKSPYIFADMPAGERKAVVYRLEQLLRRHGVIAGLEAFVALAGGETALHRPLARLRQAAALLEQGRKKTLAEWLEALLGSLAVLGVDAGLQQDDAGRQLLAALDAWRQELAGDNGRHAFNEWRRWLAQQLDSQTYRDTGIDSPVRLTHLAATRWRAFDAVLLLGGDAGRLPSVPDGGSFFNDAVRAALNLPTRAMHAARQRDDLLGLLAMNDCVLVTWQSERNGERQMLSPFLQMLRLERESRAASADCTPRPPGQAATCQLAGLVDCLAAPSEGGRGRGRELRYGDDLGERELHTLLAAEGAHTVGLPQAVRPAPSIAADAVPQSVSISAYNSLVACPYQFHARHVLRLNELDEVQEAIEKRDYGERVHDILQRFHERHPCASWQPRDEMEAALRRISEEVFADLLQQDFEARAWLARWFRSLPAYLEWQAENETQGWSYAGAESEFGLQLEGVRLCGRIDRLDVKGQEKRVLDYKTQGDQPLRDRLKEPGEDVQLPCYAFAREAGEAAFVSIEGGKVKSIAPPHEVAQLARLNAERLVEVMRRIRSGAGLPANGIDAVCAYCEMRGLCRKGEW